MLLTKCRKIAGHFNHSTMAKQELENIQVRLNQKVLKIPAIICWKDLIALRIPCRFILLIIK